MENDRIIEVRMTRRQLLKLAEVLSDVEDRGPIGAGWASPDLNELRAMIDAEIEALKKA